MKKICFILFLQLALLNVEAQISFKTEYFGQSTYWQETGGDSRERIGDTKGSAIVYQGNINVPLSIKNTKYNRPSVFSVNLNGSYASLRNKNFTGDYSGLVIDEIMNGNLSFSYLRPLNTKWSMVASLGIGIYAPFTDISKLRMKHSMGNGALIFIRHLKPNLQLGGGIAINNSFGYPMAFPAIYFDWNCNGIFDFKVSIANGLDLGVSYTKNKIVNLSLVVEMNGQAAFVEKDNEDMIFSHQYFIAGIRPELKIGKKVSIPITGGLHMIRASYFSKRSLKGMFSTDDYYFQASPYISAGLKIDF